MRLRQLRCRAQNRSGEGQGDMKSGEEMGNIRQEEGSWCWLCRRRGSYDSDYGGYYTYGSNVTLYIECILSASSPTTSIMVGGVEPI